MNTLHFTKASSMPTPVGPYSLVRTAGDLLFVSGQIGVLPETGELCAESFEEEARQAFANLTAVLTTSGCTWQNVLKIELFLTDMRNVSLVNELYQAVIGVEPFPARVTVGVASLPKNARIEVSAIVERTNTNHHEHADH